MSKKGLMASTLAKLILILFIAAILIFFVGKVTLFGKERSDIEACRLSILFAAKSKVVGAGKTLISDLKCEPQELTIKYRDVVEKGKINQDQAHKIIADAMAECWYMVGEGKLDPFSNWDTKGQSYCLICKTIKFDDKLKKYYKKEGNEFITSPIPYLKDNYFKKDQTYFEYLYKTKPEFSQEEITKFGKLALLDNSIILIMMHKYESKSTFWHIARIAIPLLLLLVGVGLILTGVGAIGGFALIGGLKLLVVGAVIGSIGIVAFIPLATDSFSECPECEAVGGVAIVPPTIELTETFRATVEGKVEEIPLCSILVN